MTDNRDDMLVKRFFYENRIEIADNGFSRRVMRSLPERAARLNRIWTMVCFIIGVIFLILTDAFKFVAGCLKGLFNDFMTTDFVYHNPLVPVAAIIIFIVVGGFMFFMLENRKSVL
ncbi:MAG: DUF5056 domain-containing protein [Prevotellaceae bacterium]|nr:DUF5056 domain-containing protein [Prevotellaceae bacterium]